MMLETPPCLQPVPDYRLISQASRRGFRGRAAASFSPPWAISCSFLYLIVSTVLSAVFSVLSVKSHVYYLAYIAAQPVAWCAAALAVREMFALIFRDYPGLQTAGRWALYVALGYPLRYPL